MKSIWKTAWALERRSPALLPTISTAGIPGSRRHRSPPRKDPGRSGGSSYDTPYPSYHSHVAIRNLKESLESQAQNDATPQWTSKTHSRRPGVEGEKRYGLFKRLVRSRFDFLMRSGDFRDLRPLGIRSKADLYKEAALFRTIIDKAFELAHHHGQTRRQQNPYFWSWRNAFVTGDTSALHTELKYSFTSFIVRQHLSKDAIACHEKLADFRFPHEWFPATRTMQRKIHLHVGPTNSGKTYNALKALEESKTGIYAGPLRLLAHETYMRFMAKGKRCALVTGEELRIPEGDGSYFASCTVEMTPLNRRVDVAVIDEIQMIGDEQRGWAWTQALLGVQAKEVHLCGEERVVPLIEAICAKMGDEVVVHRYQRLNPLQPMQEGLGGKFENLRKGDAVVSFSRVNLHTLKAGIEEATGKKCAIVYGALPPESRAQQAALFNDPDNDYDFLAASDAIGMGLNLEIRRVVFEAVTKHDGIKIRGLTLPELKQIGGRAGRFRTAAQGALDAVAASAAGTSDAAGLVVLPTKASPGASPDSRRPQPGFVTTLENEDLDVVHESFDQEAEPLETAGLFPPSFVIEKFASYFPAGTPFSFILLRLRDIARLPSLFQMCTFKENIQIATLIQPFNLTVHDRCIFLTAPVSLKDVGMPEIVRALAKRVMDNESGHLLDIDEIKLEILDHTKDTYPTGPVEFLKHLESLHKSLTLYLWLSYRYAGIFQSQALAFHVKGLVEERINKYLDTLDYSPQARKQRIAEQRRAVSRRRVKEKQVFGDTVDEVESKPVGGDLNVWNEGSQDETLFSGLDNPEDTPPVPNASR